ncbi:MAG TPA: NAD(P)H-binding protein [Polyangiaceae bacterium]|nr:NAD(P)H-binding protein [Polyangiaceae bacterium]
MDDAITHPTKTALVLGATGGIGGEVAEALRRHGWAVRGLARDPAAARRARPGAIEWVAGDAMVAGDVARAARGATLVVHAVNPPGYRHWGELVLPMIDHTIAAARAAGGARILLPGTIYNVDPAATPVLDEASPQRPRSRKGALRVELERRLEAASAEAPALIVRAGDFFGPRAKASWFSQAMVRPGRPVTRLVNPAKGVGHSWAYLPDLAEAMARLLDVPERLRPFERVQFEGFWDADGSAMPAALRAAVGSGRLTEHAFPWWLMRALAPFGGFPREAADIAATWRYPVRFDNRRLEALIGPEPRTPVVEALRATLAAMGCLPAPAAAPRARPA